MKTFPFDPTKRGMARWLGDGIQMILMEYIWSRNEPMIVRRIYKEFAPRWTYNTVSTTLQRLADTGLLRVTRQRYGYHLREFTPAMSRLDWEQYQVNAIIKSLSIAEQAAVGDGWGYGGW